MRYTLFILFLFVSKVSFGQPELINQRLKNVNEGTLYIGVDNIISISGQDNLSDSIQLVSTIFEVYRFPDEKVFNVSAKYLQSDTLKLYEGEKLIAQKFYKAEKICMPIATYGIYEEKELSIQQLLSTKKLICTFPCNYYTVINVVSFHIGIIKNGWEETDFVGAVDGNEIPIEYYNSFKFLKKGDKIIFSKITVMGHDVCPRRLYDLEISIK